MFTNWLTGTSSSGGAANQNSSSENRSTVPTTVPTTNNNSSNAHPLMSTPPDVILEVGSVPNTVRFVAHSIVLGMHSGYLRSAIRIDERTSSSSGPPPPSPAAPSSSSPDFVVYLGNVTPEQFAPLLTYMYTGFLDLNIENIFGVLLATHVLHMPRALEICRAFLARAQTEGYLGAARLNMNNLNANNNNNNGSGKIIRPIASKPTVPSFGFLPALPTNATTAMTLAQQQQQHSQQLLPTGQLITNYKGYPTPILLNEHNERQQQQQNHQQQYQQQQQQQQRANSEEIDVDKESTCAASIASNSPNRRNDKQNAENDDDEDEEVFIDDVDSNTPDSDNDESEVIIELKSQKKAKATNCKVESRSGSSSDTKSKHNKKADNHLSNNNKALKQYNRGNNTPPSSSSSNTTTRRDQRRGNKSRSRSRISGLQIAKAPIPASQLDINEGSKVIIDVASCDGPVRFRRILNTAYGHKPEDFSAQIPERSQQSVSYSFHQQMARTINQQQRQQQQKVGGEESENSEASSGVGGGAKNGAANKSGNGNASSEIYVCVYCKHTFKSHYCYQKHAKRHLNPLSLSGSGSCSSSGNINVEKSTLMVGGGGGGGYNNIGMPMPMPIAIAATKPTTTANATELLRREVRPLDMNVQYYPCKTCGSKFPSYYFVHKHRKMCHADEEPAAPNNGKDNATEVQRNDNNSRGGSNGNVGSDCDGGADAANSLKQDQRESNQGGGGVGGGDSVIEGSSNSNSNGSNSSSLEHESKGEN